MSAPPLADVVAALDDETLLRTMREQLVRSFPSFEGAPPRVRAIRDRLMREVDSAPDLLEALDHPCLRELFGAIEDSGTKEADALWSRAVAWFDVRDAALKKARPE